MLYAVLCYNDEEMVCGWTKAQDDAVMAALSVAHDKWGKTGKLKPSIRLLPTSAATTLHKQSDMVIDGPYAETKEALLGFYIIQVDGLDEGLETATSQARRDLVIRFSDWRHGRELHHLRAQVGG